MIKSCYILLQNKFVHVHKDYGGARVVLHTEDSLSIGEHIATAASSIYKCYYYDRPMLCLVEAKADIKIIMYGGYIDDLYGICLSADISFRNFSDAMQTFESTIVLTIDASQHSIEYLDLVLKTNRNQIITRSYRKLIFCEQYIHSSSYHRPTCFAGIWLSEQLRFLVNTDFPEDFSLNVKMLGDNLTICGLPVAATNSVSYDQEKTNARLLKFAERAKHQSNDDDITVLFECHRVIQTTGILNMFRVAFEELQSMFGELKQKRLCIVYKSYLPTISWKITSRTLYTFHDKVRGAGGKLLTKRLVKI